MPFLELPGEPGRLPRPVASVDVESTGTPIVCLVDTGTTGIRFGAYIATHAGINLDDALAETEVAIAGLRTTARCARVSLTVAGHRYDAPVWFCDPWPFGFGILGQEGFFRHFRVTICAAEGWLECVPEPAPASP